MPVIKLYTTGATEKKSKKSTVVENSPEVTTRLRRWRSGQRSVGNGLIVMLMGNRGKDCTITKNFFLFFICITGRTERRGGGGVDRPVIRTGSTQDERGGRDDY